MGHEKADAGQFTVGETVKLGYVDQAHTTSIGENGLPVCFGGNEEINVGGRFINDGPIITFQLREPTRKEIRRFIGG
jgi:ATPase subunit of ABC transporter with duplicated ATPase domains